MVFGRESPTSFREAVSLSERLLSASNELVKRGSIQAEAEQIVQAAYRKATGESLSRLDLFARMGDRFPEQAGQQVIVMSMARAEGKILQHLTGYQAFLDHEYRVGPEVLVPRPETELLVVTAIAELEKQGISPKLGLEIGLGSGIISIELLSRFPGLKMVATELTDAAARLARVNAESILGEGANRLRIVKAQTELEVMAALDGVAELADFLISNPPYLNAGEAGELDADVAGSEPRQALYAPAGDPLFFYREIAVGVRNKIRPGGMIFLEMPHERAAAIQSVFRHLDPDVKVAKDLNGHDRVLIATHRS